MFNYTIPLWLQSLFHSLTWKVKTDQQEVYFTFDDGPHPEITPWVIDKLDEYNAKATFFCVGENVFKYPQTHQLLIDKGHTVGNHTYNHLKGWKTNNRTYLENIEKCNQLTHSKVFRPPYGRIKPSQIKPIKEKYKIIMWDVLTCDYDNTLTPVKILNSVMQKISPGSIIVLHDSLKAENNMKAILPELLKHCVEKGYTFGKF